MDREPGVRGVRQARCGFRGREKGSIANIGRSEGWVGE